MQTPLQLLILSDKSAGEEA